MKKRRSLLTALVPALLLAAAPMLFAADPIPDPADPASPTIQTPAPAVQQSTQPAIGLRTDVTADASSAPSVDTSAPKTVASADADSLVGPTIPSLAAAAELATPQTSSAPPAPAPSSSASHTKSPNSMVNLVHLLVEQGVIQKEKGDALIQQAEAEAQEASAAQSSTNANNVSTAISSQDKDVEITYVPKPVEDKIRSDIKQEVMDQARDENWAAPRKLPSWLQKITFFGDTRIRFEGDYFPSGNLTPQGNSFFNYNAINTGSPFPQSPNSASLNPIPTYNVDQDRERLRLRARLGLNADLGDGFTSGFRIASGSDNSPVTENQTFGAASGQGGDFSKYSVWVDRGFIKKEWGGLPTDLYDVSITAGRFDNPFFHTSMIWADDLGFDGAAVQAKYQVTDGVTPFFAGGAFPVYNTDLNFGTGSTSLGSGYASEDKWLYAAQLGTNWKVNDDINVKVAGAFYDFQNIEGKVSSPIPVTESAPGQAFNDTAGFVGPTDDSRPSFAQHGNTYIQLRDYVPTSGTTAINNYQYYGLATPFREAALTGQIDYNRFDPFHISLIGEMVKNVAWDKNAIQNNGPIDPVTGVPTGPQNNVTSVSDGGQYLGGDMGWYVRLNLGSAALEKQWDWNVNIGYRYVESDAVVDGFTDADFGGYINGTNLKGYTLGGNVALSSNVWFGLRWMSADSICGPPLTSDTLQVDLNAKF